MTTDSLALILLLAIVATLGLLVSVLSATVINRLFPQRATVVPAPAPMVALPTTRQPKLPIDPSILKALVKRGFRPEMVEQLWQSGKLTVN
jgi:hypothetical protein